MSWDISLHDDRGHLEGSWNYTHNVAPMIYLALADRGIKLPIEPDRDRPMPWWMMMEGKSGPDGARFLSEIIAGLQATPARFRAMNPDNGWGSYDRLVEVLTEMMTSVPEWPSEWTACG